MVKNQGLRNFFQANGEKLALASLLLVFIIGSLFIALNINTGIIPDEIGHFLFSKHYSTTIGIPEDTSETFKTGWLIWQNPFLYYWLMARVINFSTAIQPSITDLGLLITLRVVNVLFATGTIIFCYLLSCEIIPKKWWRLLPVFILTNILMFVFLAGGVNYDNLANLLSMGAIYFFVLSIQKKKFITNTSLSMIFIFTGTLVKYPLLPLALGLTSAWFVFIITQRKTLWPMRIERQHIVLLAILILLLAGNFAIYGINLIRYQAITPPCIATLTQSQCELNPYAIRYQEMAFKPKLTVAESVRMGFPSPIKYALYAWPYFILIRTLGVTGHQSYNPFQLMPYYQVLFYGAILLSVINTLYHRRLNKTGLYLFGIMSFYLLTLFLHNYNSELIYGFQHISFQGRYIFPVIGIILVLFTRTLMNIPNRIFRWIFTIYTVGIVTYGGILTILIGYDSYFSGWFF